MQFSFGSGQLFGTPTIDANGNAIANPTPARFGAIQGIMLDIASTNKELRGQNQFPLAVGRGPAKLSGKAQFAQINGALLNSLYFGQTLNTGSEIIVVDSEAGTIPTTPFQITVAQAATFAQDLGVYYGANGTVKDGLQLTRVASSPAVGQYSVNVATGVYTFNTADNASNPKVTINYEYTGSGTTGYNLPITNKLMGLAPTFRADMYTQQQGKQLVITLYSCIAGKLGFSTKLDDFMIPDFEFDAFADASGQVMKISTVE